MASTKALAANMPEDAKLLADCKRVLEDLGFCEVVVPQGMAGKEAVNSSKRTSGMTCKIHVKPAFVEAVRAHAVEIYTKEADRAIGAFGCAITHRNILEKVRVCDYVVGMASLALL